MFDAADVLIGLVSFAGHQYDVARPRQRDGRLDRLAPIGNAEVTRGGVEPGLHFRKNRLGILLPGIVRGEHGQIGPVGRDASHFGTFRPVAVASAAYYHIQLPVLAPDFVDRIDDVLQRVGRMRIVDDRRHAVVRADRFEAAVHRSQAAQRA